MIEFACKNCDQKLKVEEKHSGKRIKCPKCGSAGIVPDNSDKIKFHCDSCGQSISVPQIHAGKKGKCPKCKTPIVVPSPMSEPAGAATPDPSIPSDAEEDYYEDESDLPEEGAGPDRRLIIGICGAVAVVLVGLIILVAVILPSGSGPSEEPYKPPEQEAADVDSPSSPVASDAEPAGTFMLQPPNEDGAPRESAQSSAAAGADSGKLDLKLRLKPGRKYNLQIVRDSKNSQTTSRGPVDYNDINTMGLEIEVEQVDTQGVAWLKVTYLTIHEIRSSALGQDEYDSTKPDTAVSYPNSGPLYTAMIGQSFRARVTPEGEIVELGGLAEMYDQMAKLVVEYEDEAIRQRMAKYSPKTVEERAQRSIDRRNQHYGSRDKRIEARRQRLEDSGQSAKGLIREMLGNVIMPFPAGLVGIGDSWQGKTALFSTGAGDIGLDDCTYTLKEARRDAVLVDFGSEIEVDDELLSGERGKPGAATVTLAGSCQGSLEIDPATGWVLRKTASANYAGEWRFAPSEHSPQGMTMPVSRETVVTIKPIGEASVSLPQDAADAQPTGASTAQPPKEDTPPKERAQSSAAPGADSGKLDLKLRLGPGRKHRLRLYREYNSSYTVKGQPRESSGALTTDLEFEVGHVDANGIMSLKVTHLRFHETDAERGQDEYDSSKPETLGNARFGSIFSALVGQSFVAKVTPEGKIVELDGLPEMYQRMAEPLVKYEDEATRQMSARMETGGGEEDARRRIDRVSQKHGSREKRIEATRDKLDKGPYTREENIRDMLAEVIMSFSGVPVEIGDSWTVAASALRQMELGDYVYTLRENKPAAVSVDISTKIDVDRERPASADGSRRSSRTILTGSGQGYLEIDPRTGWMLRKNMSLRYSGETRAGPSKRNPKGVTMAQSMENVTTVEPIE